MKQITEKPQTVFCMQQMSDFRVSIGKQVSFFPIKEISNSFDDLFFFRLYMFSHHRMWKVSSRKTSGIAIRDGKACGRHSV